MKSATQIPLTSDRRRGYTLVEIMVVVGIIGFLAALALPSMGRARTNSQGAAFINNLRLARAVFEAHVIENGFYPDDTTPGVIPDGMAQDLKSIQWARPTPIGGQWDWDYLQFGVTAGVSVFMPNFSDEQMTRIDQRIDDGDLSSGQFRQRAGGYIFIIE
jgi:prepilin-type N-terminal cleavage/methylation domain-containing protein